MDFAAASRMLRRSLAGAFLLGLTLQAQAATPVRTASATQFVADNAPSTTTSHVVPTLGWGPTAPEAPQDHSKFKQLQGPFTSGPQVTQACLSCHTDAAKQVMATSHWTWKVWDPKTHQMLGKNHVYNNFCVSPISNEQFCTVCHAGYGSTDPNTFIPFSKRPEKDVDCLVCHDQTKDYHKMPFMGGNPAVTKVQVRPGCAEVYGTDKPYVDPENLAKIAQHVGLPTRYTCGSCHFYGGGGNGVKHGDMDSSLADPARAEDVHMATKGLNFACQQCHVTTNHKVPGSRYLIDADPKGGPFMPGSQHNPDPASCTSCHGQEPHVGHGLEDRVVAATLNMHTRDIACETCHIPEYARGGLPTKMQWNYATAGKLNINGEPLVLLDHKGWNTYWGVKGSFKWATNVVPSYVWFNGVERWMTIGSKVQDYMHGGAVQLNLPQGSPTDGKSKIWPFKIMRNNQPYDTKTGILAVFHSFGFDKDAYTENYKWQIALRNGMKAAGLPYSGHYAFIHTDMYWPIAHMVAPKEQALQCDQCHAAQGRLEAVDGVYMPERTRDHQPWLERLGLLLAALALAGVVVHALLRIVLRRR